MPGPTARPARPVVEVRTVLRRQEGLGVMAVREETGRQTQGTAGMGVRVGLAGMGLLAMEDEVATGEIAAAEAVQPPAQAAMALEADTVDTGQGGLAATAGTAEPATGWVREEAMGRTVAQVAMA